MAPCIFFPNTVESHEPQCYKRLIQDKTEATTVIALFTFKFVKHVKYQKQQGKKKADKQINRWDAN